MYPMVPGVLLPAISSVELIQISEPSWVEKDRQVFPALLNLKSIRSLHRVAKIRKNVI